MNKVYVIILALMLSACVQNMQNQKNMSVRESVKDPLVRGLIRAESGWNKNAISRSGAIGMTQVLPSTARAECGLSRSELFDSEKNIRCGTIYLSKVIARGGSGCSGLHLYNAGIYSSPRCTGYGRKVLMYAEQERRSPFSTVPPQHRTYIMSKYAFADYEAKE